MKAISAPFKAFLLVASIMSFAILPACETLEELEDAAKESEKPEETPEYVISIHEIVKYPKAQMIEQKIPTFSGTEVWVNRNPFLHSRNIEKVELVEEADKPGFYDLQLTLDRRGRMMWTNISVSFKGQKVACVIDGVFYRAFIPEQLESDEDKLVIIPGPFDKSTAMAVQKYSERNYKIFNKD